MTASTATPREPLTPFGEALDLLKDARYELQISSGAIHRAPITAERIKEVIEKITAFFARFPIGESASSAVRGESYWLIERGSPCEWWVCGTGKGDGTMIYEEWTRDASKALRFNEWGATHHAKELESWGVKGPLRATEHIDCAGPDLSAPSSTAGGELLYITPAFVLQPHRNLEAHTDAELLKHIKNAIQISPTAEALVSRGKITPSARGESVLIERANSLLPRLEHHYMVGGEPEKRSLTRLSAELIKDLIAMRTD